MRKIDIRWLPYMGAIVQAGLFAVAGLRHFGIGAWGAAAGFGVGMLVNFSMAIASSRVSDIAKSRKPLGYSALLLLFCVSPAVIASSLGFTPANLFWSLAADLSIMLTGAIAGKSLVTNGDENKPPKSAEAPAQSRSAKKKVRSAEIVCAHAGAGCSRTFASQNAANAHAAKCGYKPMAILVDEKVTRA